MDIKDQCVIRNLPFLCVGYDGVKRKLTPSTNFHCSCDKHYLELIMTTYLFIDSVR